MNDMKTTDNQFHLEAIAWKCHQTGLRYGQLMNSYRSSEIQQIYDEFREVVIARKQKNSVASNRDVTAPAKSPYKNRSLIQRMHVVQHR